jgi:hypothetical protein
VSDGSPGDGLRGIGEVERTSLVMTFEEAAAAHARWRTTFSEAIRNGGEGLEVEVIRLDNLCPLGRWLNGDGERAVGNVVGHRMLANVHAEFHTEAARVLALAQRGRVHEAQRAMDADQPYGTWSTTLVAALSQYASALGDAVAG